LSSKIGKPRVSVTEMEKGINTTSPISWFLNGKSEDEVQKNANTLWDYLKQNNNFVLIRMHVFYPFTDKTKQCEFKSGQTRIQTCNLSRQKKQPNNNVNEKESIQWKEIIIDIDAKSFVASELFPLIWNFSKDDGLMKALPNQIKNWTVSNSTEKTIDYKLEDVIQAKNPRKRRRKENSAKPKSKPTKKDSTTPKSKPTKKKAKHEEEEEEEEHKKATPKSEPPKKKGKHEEEEEEEEEKEEEEDETY